MSEPLQVRVSREGKEIGTYLVQEAIRLLVYGTLKETDHYWHEGMTDWAPLTQLQASEARRQLAERALQQKQEEERKAAELAKKRRDEAEQLRHEQAKAKEEEERAVAEATRVRMEKRRENFFTCNCCKDTFDKPVDPRGLFWKGFAIIILAGILFLIALAAAGAGRGDSPAILVVGLTTISALATLWGAILILSSGLRSPFCPGCHSTNYSRPNKGERPVFD
jgi:Fe2+ transport system protein B